METLDGRSSARTALLKLVTYAFVAAYTALFGKGRKEAIELTGLNCDIAAVTKGIPHLRDTPK